MTSFSLPAFFFCAHAIMKDIYGRNGGDKKKSSAERRKAVSFGNVRVILAWRMAHALWTTLVKVNVTGLQILHFSSLRNLRSDLQQWKTWCLIVALLFIAPLAAVLVILCCLSPDSRLGIHYLHLPLGCHNSWNLRGPIWQEWLFLLRLLMSSSSDMHWPIRAKRTWGLQWWLIKIVAAAYKVRLVMPFVIFAFFFWIWVATV